MRFIGQEDLKSKLRSQLEYAAQNETLLPHMLFCGPKGMGRTALGLWLADEARRPSKTAVAEEIHRPGDLAALLTNLEPGSFLLLNELDVIPKVCADILAVAIEDHALDIVIGKGPSARQIRLALPPFTLIGTTTRPSRVHERLLRWMVGFDLKPYTMPELCEIIHLLGSSQELTMDAQAALAVANNCDGSPAQGLVIVEEIEKSPQPYEWPHYG